MKKSINQLAKQFVRHPNSIRDWAFKLNITDTEVKPRDYDKLIFDTEDQDLLSKANGKATRRVSSGKSKLYPTTNKETKQEPNKEAVSTPEPQSEDNEITSTFTVSVDSSFVRLAEIVDCSVEEYLNKLAKAEVKRVKRQIQGAV